MFAAVRLGTLTGINALILPSHSSTVLIVLVDSKTILFNATDLTLKNPSIGASVCVSVWVLSNAPGAYVFINTLYNPKISPVLISNGEAFTVTVNSFEPVSTFSIL